MRSASEKVLKFTGFYEEDINAPTSLERETRRVHHVEVYYYLEDDSLHVSEPRVQNSGLPQGLLIKRHRIPHPEPAAPGRVKHNEPAPPGSALALKRTPLAPRYWTYRDLDIGNERAHRNCR